MIIIIPLPKLSCTPLCTHLGKQIIKWTYCTVHTQMQGNETSPNMKEMYSGVDGHKRSFINNWTQCLAAFKVTHDKITNICFKLAIHQHSWHSKLFQCKRESLVPKGNRVVGVPKVYCRHRWHFSWHDFLASFQRWWVCECVRTCVRACSSAQPCRGEKYMLCTIQ